MWWLRRRNHHQRWGDWWSQTTSIHAAATSRSTPPAHQRRRHHADQQRGQPHCLEQPHWQRHITLTAGGGLNQSSIRHQHFGSNRNILLAAPPSRSMPNLTSQGRVYHLLSDSDGSDDGVNVENATITTNGGTL